MSHSPRVVLITGASSGIGEATAHQAAERGDHLVLLARGPEALARAAAECDELGAASTMVVPCDVSDDDSVRAAVAAAVAEHGRLDEVVSCAGVVAYGRLEAVPVEVFDQVLATNLGGAVNLTRHVLPVLRDQDSGSLVFVGSVLGHVATPDMAAYVLSKWGVRGLVRQLRVDNRDRPGISFGYVAPGGVDTPIYRQAANYNDANGRPPFPVSSPERAAARVLAVADQSSRSGQLGLANDVIRFGFSTLPWAYDRLVGPMFRLIAQDQLATVDQGPGNVLEPREELNEVHGHHPNAALAILRNVAALGRGGAAGR
ncbi:SDR family NAD(P)-dependent oxidoreductase [Nocardioides piscis]|uniref:SDR family oxidoreductase n=1 Tax=Nocardioides piscis TaxID=2714938 RepID=A0A6G7YCH9_9ACTN|nr:SDR family oxidoreductase [Nocardioides piscis]QIK74614.1 SDR family oxidoreductase [Nocardioides piscis]